MPYFVRIREKSFGPFEENELLDMKSKGKLSRMTEISENRVDWHPAESYAFLGFPTAAAPQSEATYPVGEAGRQTQQSEVANWFYSVNGTEGFGPVTPSAIVQMIQSGTLRENSYAWQEGQLAQHLHLIPAFSALFSASPPQGTGMSQPASTTPFQPNASGVFCASCGNPVLSTSAICPRCGSPIVKPAPQPFSTPPYPYAQSPGYSSSQYGREDPARQGIGYFDVLKKYVVFHGRARRREYWPFVLINTFAPGILIFMVGFAIVLVGAFSGIDPETVMHTATLAGSVCWLVVLLYQLAILLPSLGVCVRRLHDTGNSGWMILVALIPFVGGIILLVILLQDSQPGDNLYGPNPKSF